MFVKDNFFFLMRDVEKLEIYHISHLDFVLFALV